MNNIVETYEDSSFLMDLLQVSCQFWSQPDAEKWKWGVYQFSK